MVRRGGKVLLMRYGDGERWAGLWDFPRFACAINDTAPEPAELIAQVLQKTGLTIENIKPVTTIRHGVTRFRIVLDCFEAIGRGRLTAKIATGASAWARLDGLAEYPLSATGRKLANLIAAPRSGN